MREERLVEIASSIRHFQNICRADGAEVKEMELVIKCKSERDARALDVSIKMAMRGALAFTIPTNDPPLHWTEHKIYDLTIRLDYPRDHSRILCRKIP